MAKDIQTHEAKIDLVKKSWIMRIVLMLVMRC